MRRKSFDQMECGIARALEVIGDPWSILIVRDALFGTDSFDAFQKSLDIPRNTLSDRLERLQDFGILTRRPCASDGRRFEYKLEPAGQELAVVLAALSQWGNRNVFGESFSPSFVADSITRQPIQEISLISADGRPLQLKDITMIPGPAASPRLRRVFERMDSEKIENRNKNHGS